MQKYAYNKILALTIISLSVLCFAPFIGMHILLPINVAHDSLQRQIFFSLRLPRTITAFLAGGGLALCGVVLQAMFRNPLAEPFTLGISSGAAFGAALTILLGLPSILPGIPMVSFGALCGALTAIALVYGFSKIHRYTDSHSMLLSGIVVSFFFSSAMMFAQYVSNFRDSFYIVRWLMGGIETFGYSQIFILLFFIVIGSIIISWKLPEIDLLLTGDDIAQSRGVNIARTKALLLFAVTLIAGSIVAQCGPIGFIGLIVPFIARSFFTINHKVLGPVAFMLGGIFLVFCDTYRRTIFSPVEIPVGVITSMIGAPFFLWLLLSKRTNTQRGIF
jgi:iron complex transport system permease protein